MKNLNNRNEINTMEELKQKVSNATYVIQSTLNQAVNYIPAKILGFTDIVNITITDSLRFGNAKWDKNLYDLLGFKPKVELTLTQNELNDIKRIKDKLIKIIEDKSKIFWNITGGQRPLVMAVYQIISETPNKEHFVCYLEGNKGQMIVSDKNFQKIFAKDYSLLEYDKTFNIETALKLMGFQIKSVKGEREKDNFFKINEEEFIQKVSEKYFANDGSNEINKDFLLDLIESNGKDAITFEEAVKKHLPTIDFDFSKYHGENRSKFGYLLEDFVVCKIKNNKDILDFKTSVKIDFKDGANSAIDEFDILILNKFGQLLNIECKSGGMTGDVAKSTKYSTYAASGVYGLPILLSPISISDKNEIDTIKYSEESFKNIKKAVNSANNATLKIWGIDKIAENLEKYL